MAFSWGNSRSAFADAAGWFVRTGALAGDRWDRPGLGEWDVRSRWPHQPRAGDGSDLAAAVAQLAARVLALVATHDGTALVTTIAGGMRLADYLPTRTFELAVHTAPSSRRSACHRTSRPPLPRRR